MAEAGSGDTSQLAGSSDETVCMFRVGSFNVDIDQNMRTRKRCRQHGPKIEYILTTTVQDAGLHFVDLCELDSLRQKLLLGIPGVDVRFAWRSQLLVAMVTPLPTTVLVKLTSRVMRIQ